MATLNKQPTRSVAYMTASNGYDGEPAAEYVDGASGFSPGWGKPDTQEWPQLDIGSVGVTIKSENGASTLIPWWRVLSVNTSGPRS